MTLEQQTVSREIAEKLRDLGVPQNSLFSWIRIGIQRGDYKIVFNEPGDDTHPEDAAAFTVAELGELLWRKASSDNILKAYGYVFNVPETRFITSEGLTQCMKDPDIGGKMLITLLENSLVDLRKTLGIQEP